MWSFLPPFYGSKHSPIQFWAGNMTHHKHREECSISNSVWGDPTTRVQHDSSQTAFQCPIKSFPYAPISGCLYITGRSGKLTFGLWLVLVSMPVLTLRKNLRHTKIFGCIVINKCVTSLSLHILTKLHIMNKPKNSNTADFDYSPTKAYIIQFFKLS